MASAHDHSAHKNPDPDSGDAWVVAATGEKYWGRFGAAGLLAYDPDRGILLQHRAEWTSHGDTWGVPGGARHRTEDAVTAAFRETVEETGINTDSLTVITEYKIDKQIWHYTTVIARATAATVAADWNEETIEMRWIPLPEVASYKLHPGFRDAWPELLEILSTIS